MAAFDHQMARGKTRLCDSLGIAGVGVAPVARRQQRRGRANLDLPYDWENFGSAGGASASGARSGGAGGGAGGDVGGGGGGGAGAAADGGAGGGGEGGKRRRKIPRVKAPVLSPHGGTFDQMVEIWVSCATEDSDVYYCIDQEWEPTSSHVGGEGLLPFEHEGMDTKPITLSNQGYKRYKFQAFAMREHWKDSPVVSAVFVVQDPVPDRKWNLAGPAAYVYDPAVDVCPDWSGLNRQRWLKELWEEFVARRTRAGDADGVLARWRPDNIDFESFWRNNQGALPMHLMDKPPHEQKRWFEEYFRGKIE